MPESLLTVLKLALVGVLYLFFFRVLRAVWAEIQAPKQVAAPPAPPVAVAAPPPMAQPSRPPAGPPTGAPAGPLRSLHLMEPPGLRGSTFVVDGDELTVGRGAGCAVRVDEPTVSQVHARLFRRAGQLMVEDLGSRNGTYVNRRPVTAPTPLQRGDLLGIGPVVVLEPR